MFSSIGWGEIMVLIAAGLIILGPERLPGALSWTMKSIRQVRDYATGATDQLKQELGPEFDELRAPLSQLNELRGMTPRAVVTKHLLDGDDSVFRAAEEATTFDRRDIAAPAIKPVSAPMPNPDVETAPAQAAEPVTLHKAGADSAAQATTAAEGAAPHRRDPAEWDAT